MSTQSRTRQSTQLAGLAVAVQWVVVPAVMLVGLLFQLMWIKAPANLYDEGLVLFNASRILGGEVPYRDFWTIYAPGYYYILAGLFKLSGATILTARIFDILVRFLVTVGVYTFSRRLAPWWAALIPFAFTSLWMASIRSYAYPGFPALGAVFLALILFSRYLDTGARRWLFLSGLALGLTAALRLDFGGYAAVGTGLGLLVHEGWAVRRKAWALQPALHAVTRAGLPLISGALLVALPLFGGLALAAGPEVLWSDLIQFPATTFREMRHLPIPAPLPDFAVLPRENWRDWLRMYLPLLVFLIALLVGLASLWRNRAASRDRRGVLAPLWLALAMTGFGLLVKASSRYSLLNALPVAFLGVVTATALFSRLPIRGWRKLPFLAAFSLFLFLAVLDPYVLSFTDRFAQVSAYHWNGCYSTLPRAACIPLNPDQQAAVEWVQARTRPDEYIFVANKRHDRIYYNDMLFYFLADRPSPTVYTELHPGLATTHEVQQAIIADLQAKDVRWIVVSQGFLLNEPNASSLSSGITDLDDFIRENYHEIAANPSYHLVHR